MIQEDKELLLKDLCARLPYGVKCKNVNHVYGKNVFKVTDIRDNGYICGTINNQHCWAVFEPLELKPYLRPMSSMTDREKFAYRKTQWIYQADYCAPEYFDGLESYDWLNKNHFDYRGLIEKGLAIEAPEGMYN